MQSRIILTLPASLKLQAQIDERRQFLDQMTALGKGKEHRDRIESEIGQRMKILEAISAERDRDLAMMEASASRR